MRLFIDECISPYLAEHLCRIGHDAAHPLTWGGRGASDREIRDRCIREDRVLVTENGTDFRGLVGKVPLHPGLIILPNAGRRQTLTLFDLALRHIAAVGEPDAMAYMVNRVIEISQDRSIEDYLLPPI